MYEKIKVIAFDADDTLWVNEPYFQETEKAFCELMKDFGDVKSISEQLFKIEIQNLPDYGFGAKAFMLSMIETAILLSDSKVKPQTIKKIISLGKELLNRPIELLPGVVEVLSSLQNKHYRLIVATKGDLLDQERKLKKSALEKYFHHIEIMSDKKESDYQKLINHLDINPDEFLMVGNSLKSDILPVIALGGNGVYVPFHTTWEHEKVDENKLDFTHFSKIEKLIELLKLVDNEKDN